MIEPFVEIGKKYKDTLSGFIGIAVFHEGEIYCRRIGLKHNNDIEYFDEKRLVPVEDT